MAVLSELDFHIKRTFKKMALDGKHASALLPTGFSKSLVKHRGVRRLSMGVWRHLVHQQGASYSSVLTVIERRFDQSPSKCCRSFKKRYIRAPDQMVTSDQSEGKSSPRRVAQIYCNLLQFWQEMNI